MSFEITSEAVESDTTTSQDSAVTVAVVENPQEPHATELSRRSSLGDPAGSDSETMSTKAVTSSEAPVLPPEYYASRLSSVGKLRKPSPIWDLFSVETRPGMLSMLAGKPHPSTFPFEHITLGVRAASSGEVTNLTLKDEELAVALQYGMTAGIPELVEWVSGMMCTVHTRGDPATERWRVSLGAGSQDLLYKAFNALLNPGETILVEGPTYPTIMPILDSIGCAYSVVHADGDGISVEDLERILDGWDPSVQGPLPRVLYTVPFGSNPAGVTVTYERRVQVLRLARKFDFMILEDDPYYFLYYGEAPRPPSYFSLEKQLGGELGRVLRFDSFSKILSAGFRLGWITGPDAILTVIERHSAVSVVQPNSLSQVIIFKLLKEWGLAGLLAHTARTADFYRQRRDTLNAYLEQHLFGLAEWKPPDASMFFWIKLALPGPASTSLLGRGDHVADSTAFIRDKAIARGVLVLPGATAFPDGRKTTCVRLSFSLLSDGEMEEAVRRLAEVLREENTSTRKDSVDALDWGSATPSVAPLTRDTRRGFRVITSSSFASSKRGKGRIMGKAKRGKAPRTANRVAEN